MRTTTSGAEGARVRHFSTRGTPAKEAPMLALLAGTVFGAFDASLLASPSGEQVVSGAASFVRQGNLTTITAGNNAIINYRSFDIGASEAVRFIQPSSSSRVLNRIQSEMPTRIDGQLSANGRVYIVNPAGVMFGQGAVVNVAGLYAAAGNLSDTDFLQGNDHFTSVQGVVINEGMISARDTAIVAQRIENHGKIVSDGGLITAVIGNDVYLRQEGSRMYVRVDGRDVDPNAGPAAGSPGAIASAKQQAGILNSGTISNKGGMVTLGAGDLMSLAIHNTGTIQANGGSVDAIAHGGTIRNDGVIDVSVPSGQGGSVRIQAPLVAVTGRIDASSGDGAAGSIEVNSSVGTVIANGARIIASGGNGHASGGRVLVNSTTGDTYFENGATIDISGGRAGGDGGNLEISARKRLAVQGQIIGYAGSGYRSAVVLLDPTHIVIATPGASDAQLADGTILGGEGGDVFTVSPQSIQAFLGDVRLEATLDIAIQASINKINGGLTLLAGRDIRFMGTVGTVGGRYTGAGCDNTLRITASFIDLRAGGSIRDFARGGAHMTATAGPIRLVGAGGVVEYGFLSVPANQEILIRQRDNMVLDSSRINNTRFVRLTVESTDGSLLIDNPCSDVQEYIQLFATSKVGTTVRDRLVTSQDMHLLSDGNIFVGSHLKAQTTLEVWAGLDTSGNVTFGREGLQMWGQDVIFAAGNGGTSAVVDMRGNMPLIYGPGGAGTRPASFSFMQDAAIVDATLPTASRFGAALEGMYYHIESMGSSVTITDASRVNRTHLTLASVTGSTIGQNLNIISLDTFGPALIAANVRSDEYQFYHNATRVSGDRTLNATTVTFGGTLDSQGAGSDDSLVINANLTLGGAVGGDSAIRALTVNGTSAINGGLVRTLDTQTYNGVVTIGADTALESTNGGDITLNGTLDGMPGGSPEALVVRGHLVANAAIGSIDPLASLVVFGPTQLCLTSVTTIGQQNYGEDVVLCGDVTLTSTEGLPIVFGARVDGMMGGESESLTINGQAFFGGIVGGLDPLESLLVNGTTTIYGDGIHTIGTQIYNGDVTIAKVDTTLESTSGAAIIFNGLVDAEAGGPPERLTILGDMLAAGAIGSREALGTLSVSGASFLGGGSVTTVGTQTYTGPVTLGVSTILTSLLGETITFGGPVNGTPGGAAEALTINGGLLSNGPIGNLDPLAALTVNGNAMLCGGTITTIGAQTYNGATTLCVDTTMTSTGGDVITFNGPLDGTSAGQESLTINGDLAANGAIGALVPLESITINGDAALNGGLVATAGDQAYNGTTTLGVDTTLTSTGNGTVTFGGPLNGTPGGAAEALTINGGMIANGPIGNLDPLASLAVSGPVTLNGGGVSTVGDQTYAGALTIGSDTTLSSSSGGTIAFGGPVDGAAGGVDEALTINGNLAAEGPIGANTPLGSFVVNGNADICGGSVTTVGGQAYNGNVEICQDTTLTSTSGGNVAFAGTVNGEPGGESESLSINGNLIANGAIGNLSPLEALSVSGNSTLNGGSVSTLGDQTYAGTTTLSVDTTLSSTSGTVAFGGAVDGVSGGEPVSLAVNGNMDADGPIGANVPLEMLTVSGTSMICGGSVTTIGSQLYGGDVVLCDDTTLTSTTGSTVTFNARLDGTTPGEESLTINGELVANGAIGSQVPLESLTINGASRLNGGEVHTAGFQTYAGAVTLGAHTLLASDQGANIRFESVVDSVLGSAYDLAIRGDAQFEGAVGGTNALGSLRVDGDTDICGGSVRTVDGQIYAGDVLICADTTLTSTGNDVIEFLESVDSEAPDAESGLPAFALTINGQLRALGTMGAEQGLRFLTVNGPTLVAGGLVRTFNGQTFNGAVLLDSDMSFVNLGAGDIVFASTIDSAPAVGEQPQTPRDLIVQTAVYPGPTDGPEHGRIVFGGDVGANGILRDISLRTDGGNASAPAPSVATIIGLRSIRMLALRDFTMGGNEKFTTFGNLTISAGRRATLADLVTQGDMSVVSPSIVIQRRATGPIVRSSDGTLVQDRGVDYVAGGTINFNGAVTTTGAGPDPTFSAGAGNLPSTLNGFEFTRTAAADVSDAALRLDGVVLDQKTNAGGGPENPDDPKADLAGAIKGPQFKDFIVPRSFDLRQLARIAVEGRGISGDEAAYAATGRYMYNDLPTSVQGYGAGERSFAATRVNPKAVSAAVDRFNALFGPPWQDRTPQVAAALTAASNRYRAANGAGGASFRSYLENTPDEREALGYVRDMQALIAQVRSLGLPKAELEKSQTRIMQELSQLTGMTSDELLAVTEDQVTRVSSSV